LDKQLWQAGQRSGSTGFVIVKWGKENDFTARSCILGIQEQVLFLFNPRSLVNKTVASGAIFVIAGYFWISNSGKQVNALGQQSEFSCFL